MLYMNLLKLTICIYRCTVHLDINALHLPKDAFIY